MTYEEKKYVDARNDLIKALKSVYDLKPQQRENLARELFGAEAVHIVCNMMQQRFR